MVTKSSAANAERVKRKLGVPLTKSARVKHNVPCSQIYCNGIGGTYKKNLNFK